MSDEIREEREATIAWEMAAKRCDTNLGGGVVTDEYFCEKCKGRKAKYTMAQTRGAVSACSCLLQPSSTSCPLTPTFLSPVLLCALG